MNEIKIGDRITFYDSCNSDRKKMSGLVRFKYQLGFITIVKGIQYELKKLIDIQVIKKATT